MKLLDIYRSLEPDLRTIENGLEEAIDDDVPLLYEASTHLLKAGGKRIRPVFVLLAGKFGNYDLSQLSKVAVSLELIHMATLVHDDVIDDAATRRGQKTVKS
jgi:heptaprenyl diphosphate synthase